MICCDVNLDKIRSEKWSALTTSEGGRQVLITARITWTVWVEEFKQWTSQRLWTSIKNAHLPTQTRSQTQRACTCWFGWRMIACCSREQRWTWTHLTMKCNDSKCVSQPFISWPNSKAVRFKIIIISSCVLHHLCTWENSEKLKPSNFFLPNKQCKTKWYSIYYDKRLKKSSKKVFPPKIWPWMI